MNFKIIPRERVYYLVVHCSATPPSMDVGAEWIDRVHRQRGFFKIGYHFVIKRDGTVETGRKIFDDASAEPGAHFSGLNLVSLGICMIGGVTEKTRDGAHDPEANFTPAQYLALSGVLKSLSATYPKAETIGHGDPLREGEFRPKAAKACPSFDVRRWIAAGHPTTGIATRR